MKCCIMQKLGVVELYGCRVNAFMPDLCSPTFTILHATYQFNGPEPYSRILLIKQEAAVPPFTRELETIISSAACPSIMTDGDDLQIIQADNRLQQALIHYSQSFTRNPC